MLQTVTRLSLCQAALPRVIYFLKILAKTKKHGLISSPHINQLILKGDTNATTTKPLSFIGSGFLLPALIRILRC